MFAELVHFERLLFHKEVELRRHGLFPEVSHLSNEVKRTVLPSKSIMFEDELNREGGSFDESEYVVVKRVSVVASAMEAERGWIEIPVAPDPSSMTPRPQQGRTGVWFGLFAPRNIPNNIEASFPNAITRLCLKPLEINLMGMKDRATLCGRNESSVK